MVVATHALSYTGMDTNKALTFWVQTVAVPPFFLVDGYLFLEALGKQPHFSYKGYVKKSARRLLLPWVIFTCFYGLIRLLFEYKGLLETRIILGHGALDIFNAAYQSEIAPQMHFLLSLFVIRVLSCMTKVAAEFPPLWVGAIWAAYTIAWMNIAAAMGDEGLDPVFHGFWGLQYYLLGMVLYVYRELAGKYAGVYACSFIFVLLVLRLALHTPPIVTQYAYILSLYFGSLAVQTHAGVFSMLGKHTMGIFLFHAPIVIKGTSIIVPAIAKLAGLVQYALIVMLTVAVSLLITKLCVIVPYGTLVLGEAQKPR
jgi:hypothetical protein